MAKTQIEERFPEAGFVYIGNTRMVYSPLHTHTRKEMDKKLTDLILCASNWDTPSKNEIEGITKALVERFPDRKLWLAVEDGGGYKLVYEPEAAA